MKTTIEIPDSLLAEARKVAAREKTTVRALVEQGLREVISHRKQSPAFRLRKATFAGNGLTPEANRLTPEQLRELAYEGRGG